MCVCFVSVRSEYVRSVSRLWLEFLVARVKRSSRCANRLFYLCFLCFCSFAFDVVRVAFMSLLHRSLPTKLNPHTTHIGSAHVQLDVCCAAH